MDPAVLENWKSHHSGLLGSDLSPDLSAYWDLSREAGVDPDLARPAMDLTLPFAERKKNARMLYAYISRVMYQSIQYYRDTPQLGFAMFNKEGTLLKLFGGEAFMSFSESHGIVPLSRWDITHLGANAVSVGLLSERPVAMEGADNYCRILADTAIYFSPVTMDKNGTSEVIGGLAVIVPYEDRRPDFLGTAVLATNDVNVHMYMSMSLHHMYEFEPRGLLIVDESWKTGKLSITYFNNTLRKLFHLGDENLSFTPVEGLFDPPPENPELWEILHERRRVENIQLRLRVRGRLLDYTVSTDPFSDPGICIQGIRIYITSLEQTAAHVSKQIGNNMLLSFNDIIGTSPGIISAKNKARRYAQSDSNVLILGESGVGKDVFAQAIHSESARCDKPFVSVNCGALPRELIASELFGYDQGAFTGARKGGHIGKFELANGGTIFLDEIGDMPLDLQVMLLQVIEKKSFTRVGGKQTINVDVKIISATNANLHERIRQGKFRLDLYYRLSVLRLQLPPLRERGEDVTLLSRYFLRKLYERGQVSHPVTISPEAVEYLKQHSWPGNVRELQNVMEGVVQTLPVETVLPNHIMYYTGKIDDINDPLPGSAPSEVSSSGAPAGPEETGAPASSVHPPYEQTPPGAAVPEEPDPLKSADMPVSNRGLVSLQELKDALARNHYRREDTARELNVTRKTLYRWMKKYDL